MLGALRDHRVHGRRVIRVHIEPVTFGELDTVDRIAFESVFRADRAGPGTSPSPRLNTGIGSSNSKPNMRRTV